ncbi:hypothetical protein CGRA01v4_11346 [Colletotrichum graminicola]|nr:hypothetical protein CGRA01v4_11346 [Colletotrichum graminicola]
MLAVPDIPPPGAVHFEALCLDRFLVLAIVVPLILLSVPDAVWEEFHNSTTTSLIPNCYEK